MSSNIQIRQLCNFDRFPEDNARFLALLLYLPFGLLLFLIRLILLLFVYLVTLMPLIEHVKNAPLIEKWLTKVLCFLFGINIKLEGPERTNKSVVYVSNCTSPLDHLVIVSLTGSQTVGKKKFRFSSLRKALGINGPVINPSNLDSAKKEINDYLLDKKKGSLHIQPEEKITNGKALLKFKTWPFQLCTKVYPVTLKVDRPLTNIAITTLSSNILSDIFFYMFLPRTDYSVNFLAPVEKSTMNDEEFAEEVRKQMAQSLKIEVVNYSTNDIEEWRKRYLASLERNSLLQQSSGTQPSVMLQTMAQQVKDVLPLVPLNVIYKDLAKTRSVELTVANILDGQVSYVPETTSSTSSFSNQNLASTSSSSFRASPSKEASAQLSSPTAFGKSAAERMRSFQERKQQLIENARKRYIEKHGLDAKNFNG